MKNRISGICISARYDEEIEYISSLITQISPKTEIILFRDVLKDINLLKNVDFIFTIGGDGSVAWLIGKFFDNFGEKNLKNLKPIVPVVRPKSIGYLKQIDFEKKKFVRGFTKLQKKKYHVLDRTVLKTRVYEKDYLAVNEVHVSCAPHLGKFDVYLEDNGKYNKITTTMADGVFIVTAIGSTGWALSYGGQINLAEDTLELVFAGGIHSSANFTLPRKSIKVNSELKNSTIIPETVSAYQEARRRRGMKIYENSDETLELIYGSRMIIDGKLVAFGIDCFEVDSTNSIPFVFLNRETPLDKARKLTKQQSVK